MPVTPTPERLLVDSERRLSTVRPELVTKWRLVERAMRDEGHVLLVAWKGARRSIEEQFGLYKQGRTRVTGSERWVIFDKSKVVTYARGLDGPHPKGCALDAARLVAGAYVVGCDCPKGKHRPTCWLDVYGHHVENAGLDWGGRFPDPDRPHCQLQGWKDLP